MTDFTATPVTGTVDAPASMDSILAEFDTGNPGPSATEEEVVKELVEDAEEGQSEEEADTEDDATDATDDADETAADEPEEDGPEPTYKVKVSGEEVAVPLSELLKGYSRERDYTAKTMALAQERKELAGRYANELEQQVKAFEALDPILSEAGNIDWQQLAKDDPATYVQLKAAVDARTAAVTEARQRIEAAQGETATDPAEAAETAKAETQALVEARPELSDPAAMSAFANEVVGFLRGNGFEDGEIADLTDHRALLLIDKARRFDEAAKARASLPAKKIVPKPAVKPLRTDGSDNSRAPKPRIPGADAPREKRLDYVVNQFLQE